MKSEMKWNELWKAGHYCGDTKKEKQRKLKKGVHYCFRCDKRSFPYYSNCNSIKGLFVYGNSNDMVSIFIGLNIFRDLGNLSEFP